MTLESLTDLYTHMEWADALVWRAALATGDAPPDPRLHETLHHLHATQWAFLQVWREEEVELGEPSDLPTLVEVRDWARRYHAEVASFLGSLTPADLDRSHPVPWARYFAERVGGGPPGDTTLDDTLYQVAAHSTYHRGQVNRRIRELDAEPPLVDWIAWLWLGRPEPEWETGTAAGDRA